MIRQELIEGLCNNIINEIQVDISKNLLDRIMTNSVSLDDAEAIFNSIKSVDNRNFSTVVKSKKLKSSIKSFLNDKLVFSDSLKLISSLVTHNIIEYEQTNDAKVFDKLNTITIIDILKESIESGNISDDNIKIIKSILIDYGYSDKGE